MSRLLSRAAPQLGLIALCASSVGCLEAPPPDNSYPHVAVSGEVFRVFCRRVAKAGYPLDLYKMEQGTYIFRPDAVDLTDLVGKVLADVRMHAASKQVRLDTKLECSCFSA